MSNASVNAELVIKFRDASGPGAAAAQRTAEQTAQKVGTASERASAKAAEAAERGERREGESNFVLRKTDEYPPYRRVKVCNHCHSGKCPVKKGK